MRITFDGPQLAQWDASGAIDLWWKDKLRHQVSDIRSTPRTSHSSTIEDSDGEFNLEDWESFVYSKLYPLSHVCHTIVIFILLLINC